MRYLSEVQKNFLSGMNVRELEELYPNRTTDEILEDIIFLESSSWDELVPDEVADKMAWDYRDGDSIAQIAKRYKFPEATVSWILIESLVDLRDEYDSYKWLTYHRRHISTWGEHFDLSERTLRRRLEANGIKYNPEPEIGYTMWPWILGRAFSGGVIKSDLFTVHIYTPEKNLPLEFKSSSWELLGSYFKYTIQSRNFVRTLMSMGMSPETHEQLGEIVVPEGFEDGLLEGFLEEAATLYPSPRGRRVNIRGNRNILEWVNNRIAGNHELIPYMEAYALTGYLDE